MNEKKNTAYISHKTIADKANGNISHFVVVSTPTFDKQDWMSLKKLVEISESMTKLPLEFPLKATFKGNADENRKAQDGKALKLSLLGEIYTMEIYTQKFGESWSLSHTHLIEKKLFTAYITVLINNESVAKAEKENQSVKNFSLNLV